MLATGAQSAVIGNLLGIDIGVQAVRGQMFATKPLPGGTKLIRSTILAATGHTYWAKNNQDMMASGLTPSVTHQDDDPCNFKSGRITRHLYGKQTHDGRLIFGGDRFPTSAGSQCDGPISDAAMRENRMNASQLFPFVRQHEVVRTWAGLMPFSRDGTPLIGRIDSLPGSVHMISGFASAGMILGPACGKVLADLLMGDRQDDTDSYKEIKQMFRAKFDPNRLIIPRCNTTKMARL